MCVDVDVDECVSVSFWFWLGFCNRGARSSKSNITLAKCHLWNVDWENGKIR